MRRVLISCLEPQRRDALEETARLALTFVTVTTAPGYPDFKPSSNLEVHLSALALKLGCHLPDIAQDLLEAVQAFGIPIKRLSVNDESVSEEWLDWWRELPKVERETFDLELEIR